MFRAGVVRVRLDRLLFLGLRKCAMGTPRYERRSTCPGARSIYQRLRRTSRWCCKPTGLNPRLAGEEARTGFEPVYGALQAPA